MKSFQSINKIVSQFSYRNLNLNRFMSETINTFADQMSDQNETKPIVEETEHRDSGGDQPNAKRLKTDDNKRSDVGQEVMVEDKKPFKREKLRKWSLLLSYCGQNYYGMQRQTNDQEFPTIEYKLFESLLKNNIIGEDKFKAQHLCRFQRAARTDRGVSAIKQICSILLPQDFKDMVPKVNDVLPPEIRLIDCLRVTKFFDAKNFCDARTYSYLMPSYALCPLEENTTESFRLSEEKLLEFNNILRLYLGTNNFHNFTSGKAPTDASAMRYIISMNCSHPFIKENLEFVVIRVKGQAFMLHQIRKMIGLAIAIMRGITNTETISRAFETVRIDIPKAPGLGLLLEEVHYDAYNKKYGGDGIHDSICWSDKNETIDGFKHKHIYPIIVETENKVKPMFQWLQTLTYHTYSERLQGDNQDPNQGEDNPERSPIFMAHLNALVVNKDKLKANPKDDEDIEVNKLLDLKQN